MIYNTKAELMYPGLDGFGLGLLPDPSFINTSSPIPTGDSAIPWSCSTFGLFCNPPQVQNAQDTSAFGTSLSQENRDKATAMAAGIIAADPSLQCDPSLSNLLNPFSTSCGNPVVDALNPASAKFNWLAVGAVVFVGAWVLKKL